MKWKMKGKLLKNTVYPGGEEERGEDVCLKRSERREDHRGAAAGQTHTHNGFTTTLETDARREHNLRLLQ